LAYLSVVYRDYTSSCKNFPLAACLDSLEEFSFDHAVCLVAARLVRHLLKTFHFFSLDLIPVLSTVGWTLGRVCGVQKLYVSQGSVATF